MQTVTTAEVRESLPELLEQVKDGPLLIREGDRDIAVLVSPENFRGTDESEHLRRVEKFERLRDAASDKLVANLAREGITVEQFVKELLA